MKAILFGCLAFVLSAFSCSTGNDVGGGGGDESNPAPPMANRLTIMHTNDMHSHFLGVPNGDYTPLTTGDDDTIGGIARIAAKVKEVRDARDLEGVPALLLDAGDFAMGSLFHLLGGEAEMGVMNLMGYDHLTLGNHEFDWLPAGAASIVSHADGLPVEATNLEVTDPTDPGGQALQDLINAGDILPFAVMDLFNGLRVGLFGLMGEDADGVVFRPDPEAYPLTFADRVTIATNTVNHLRDNEGVALVICLSHSGMDGDDPTQGEDPDLARAVSGIDVIVSGHTHTNLAEPVIVDGTVIVQAYAYTKRLGVLDIELTLDGVNVLSYDSVTIDDSIPGDAETQALVQSYIDRLDLDVLGPMGYAFSAAVAETDFDLKKVYGEEHNLGNLVTDAIVWSANQVLDDPADPVDFAVESDGVIRDAILQGSTGRINTSDAFRVVPLGLDPLSGTAGYPLLSFYLTGADVRKACAVDCFAPLLNNSDYWLSYSGMGFSHAAVALINAWQCNDPSDPACTDRTTIPNDETLYRVAVNYYVALNIERMKEISGGLIDVVPRDVAGNPLANLTDAIIYEAPGDPLTQWEGFLAFLSSLPDTDDDGIPNIPARYAGPEGRIIDRCFVATAAYGTPYEEKIDVLRAFRDQVLAKSTTGKKIVDAYYAWGERLAEPVANSSVLRFLVQVLLLPVIGIAKAVLLLL
jgi:5'-nucleotidase